MILSCCVCGAFRVLGVGFRVQETSVVVIGHQGAEPSMRTVTYASGQSVDHAVRQVGSAGRRTRSIEGVSVMCSRLTINDAQKILPMAIPDETMINLTVNDINPARPSKRNLS